jgi:subtilisin family serine protease
MDRVRVETRSDKAAEHFKATGRGVLVAVIDRGIDWLNPDFRNKDGTTRIEYIFDLTDDAGANAPGNIYGMGTIYTRQQINAALRGGPLLATRDAVGHGTTTTGIICGNGRNLPSRKYRGIAPDATIISVKITSDGAPAHDGEPEESPFFDPARIPVAIDFIRDKQQCGAWQGWPDFRNRAGRRWRNGKPRWRHGRTGRDCFYPD